jgi:hypothetical protein
VGTLTLTGRRGLSGVLLCAALTAGLAGCGTTTSSTGTGARDPLSGLTASQITAKAISNLKAASAVHINGTLNSSGVAIGLDLSLVRVSGCAGTMSEQNAKGKLGSFQLVAMGKQVWVKPNRTFWKKAGGATSMVLQVVSGKYMRVKATSDLGSLSIFCNATTLARKFEPIPPNLRKAAPATIAGQRTLRIMDAADSDSLYVSDTATPEILRIAGGSDGNLDFSDFGTPVKIAAPPKSETLSGAKYGL